MALRYRRAEEPDLPFLREMLYEAVFWRKSPTTPTYEESRAMPEVQKALADFGARPGDIAVIAFTDDGTPAGAAWWRYWNEEDGVRGFVSADIPVIGIAVAESFRRRGIGRGLMEWLIGYAVEQSIPRLSLCVSKDNLSLGLYRKAGFVEHADQGHSFDMVRHTG